MCNSEILKGDDRQNGCSVAALVSPATVKTAHKDNSWARTPKLSQLACSSLPSYLFVMMRRNSRFPLLPSRLFSLSFFLSSPLPPFSIFFLTCIICFFILLYMYIYIYVYSLRVCVSIFSYLFRYFFCSEFTQKLRAVPIGLPLLLLNPILTVIAFIIFELMPISETGEKPLVVGQSISRRWFIFVAAIDWTWMIIHSDSTIF